MGGPLALLASRSGYGVKGACGDYGTYAEPASRPEVALPPRPTTFHPSQEPPLKRVPLSELLPSLPQDQVVATSRHPVGVALAEDCRPNTVEGFGRVVIRHEPLHGPVLPGRYVVVVTGLSPGSYSVQVSANLAYPMHNVVEGAVRSAASATPRIKSVRNDTEDIYTCQRLATRKRQLVGYLIASSDEAIQVLQAKIDALRRSWCWALSCAATLAPTTTSSSLTRTCVTRSSRPPSRRTQRT